MNNFCKIYVSSKCEEQELNKIVTDVCANFNLNDEIFYIDLNEEYDKKRESDFPDGFIYFKYLVDFNFIQEMGLVECVKVINETLAQIWSKKIPAVASCDYESELVNNGGYNSPWNR